MLKRLLLPVLVSLALTLGVGVSTASAQTTENSLAGGIWAGLKYGATNLQLPAGTPTTATPATTTPAPDVTANSSYYAALGDSVAAGAGLPDDLGAGFCQRSSQAYPHLVSRKFLKPMAHIACGGATVGDLFTHQQRGDRLMPPQLKSAFHAGTPNLITLTAGSNDLQWSTFINKCFAATCGTENDSRAVNGLLLAMKAKLHFAFLDIMRRSASNGTPPPQTIVTGYYNPFSLGCTQVDQRLTADEIKWVTEKQQALNLGLASVSSHYGFVDFAPVDFTGHDLCSAQSWLQGPRDLAPLHPNARGQQAIAEAVLANL